MTLPWVVRFAAVLHSSLAIALLSSRAELQEEVARVEVGRDAARQAEAESLRRLERDIHDGPQQRLVRLTMDLGRAKRQLEQDPERAVSTIDGALEQARETVAELRALSRGIAPPLLVDRGLAAALAEMLNQSVVPVTSDIDVPTPLAAARRDGGLLRGRRGDHQPREALGRARPPRSPSRSVATPCWCGSRTTASAAPTPPRAGDSPVCSSGSPRSTAPWRSVSPDGGPTVLSARIPLAAGPRGT